MQVTNLHGFAVVDWEKSEGGAPDHPARISRGAERNTYGIQGAPAHGIKASPDGTTLCRPARSTATSTPIRCPTSSIWWGQGRRRAGLVTFTPDSKFLYVANAHSNTVSVIDVAARTEVKVIEVGQVPKRNITATLPDCQGLSEATWLGLLYSYSSHSRRCSFSRR